MLQRLPAEAPPTFVTLNPPQPPAPDKTIRQMQMAHPVFSYSAYDAQQKLHTVQVTRTGLLSMHALPQWAQQRVHKGQNALCGALLRMLSRYFKCTQNSEESLAYAH